MHTKAMVDKVGSILESTTHSYNSKLSNMFDKANRIFISGAGRSKLVGSFFAMRLMHGGYNVNVVGDVVTPSINSDDLLIVVSGSGETKQLVSYTERAKAVGANIVLISTKRKSTIASLADKVFQIGSSKQYQKKIIGMPLGTVFELSALFFLESFISYVISEKGISEESMQLRHANLE